MTATAAAAAAAAAAAGAAAGPEPQPQQQPSSGRRYLTFNPELRALWPPEFLAAEGEAPPPPPSELPLQNTWKLWEQLENADPQKTYQDGMKELISFQTVQEFWRLWHLLPQPSQLMAEKRMVRESAEGGRQNIDAIMVFRENVKPEWEDELNAQGGHFEIRYPQTRDPEELARLDEHWNNVVLGIVGATVEPCGMVTGVRLVDKLHSSGRGGFIRIEVWFTDIGVRDGRNCLKASIEEKMFTRLDGTKDNSVRHLITFKTHQKNR